MLQHTAQCGVLLQSAAPAGPEQSADMPVGLLNAR